jgi:hypothetical protein
MRSILHVSTSEGEVEVREEELPAITEKVLRKLKITAKDLHRCFEEAKRLMQERGITERDRARPVAFRRLNGTWGVAIIGYSPSSDLVADVKKGTKH